MFSPTFRARNPRTALFRDCHGCPATHRARAAAAGRAPGHAPVRDPCGIAGGWFSEGAAGNGGVPPPGYKQGVLGSELPEVETKTKWKAGGTATAMWGVVANHGGGYRACTRPKRFPCCRFSAPLFPDYLLLLSFTPHLSGLPQIEFI